MSICVVTELAMAIERRVGCEFHDHDLESIYTLREFAALMKRHIAEGAVSAQPSEMLLLEELNLGAGAWRSACLETHFSVEDLDKPILDAVDPDRWQTPA